MDKNDNELLKLIPFLEKLVELVSIWSIWSLLLLIELYWTNLYVYWLLKLTVNKLRRQRQQTHQIEASLGYKCHQTLPKKEQQQQQIINQ
jgi:hypothetical protein